MAQSQNGLKEVTTMEKRNRTKCDHIVGVIKTTETLSDGTKLTFVAGIRRISNKYFSGKYDFKYCPLCGKKLES